MQIMDTSEFISHREYTSPQLNNEQQVVHPTNTMKCGTYSSRSVVGVRSWSEANFQSTKLSHSHIIFIFSITITVTDVNQSRSGLNSTLCHRVRCWLTTTALCGLRTAGTDVQQTLWAHDWRHLCAAGTAWKRTVAKWFKSQNKLNSKDDINDSKYIILHSQSFETILLLLTTVTFWVEQMVIGYHIGYKSHKMWVIQSWTEVFCGKEQPHYCSCLHLLNCLLLIGNNNHQ